MPRVWLDLTKIAAILFLFFFSGMRFFSSEFLCFIWLSLRLGLSWHSLSFHKLYRWSWQASVHLARYQVQIDILSCCFVICLPCSHLFGFGFVCCTRSIGNTIGIFVSGQPLSFLKCKKLTFLQILLSCLWFFRLICNKMVASFPLHCSGLVAKFNQIQSPWLLGCITKKSGGQ